MNDSQIISYQNRAKTLAYKILRNEQDAEDIAQLAVIERIRIFKKDTTITPRLDYIVIGCIRREFGDVRFPRGKFKYAERNQFKRIIGENEENNPECISEERLCSSEHPKDSGQSSFDQQLLKRVVEHNPFDESNINRARREGVTESRISQKRSIEIKVLVKNYLWAHYREYGIESEIEIDWITL